MSDIAAGAAGRARAAADGSKRWGHYNEILLRSREKEFMWPATGPVASVAFRTGIVRVVTGFGNEELRVVTGFGNDKIKVVTGFGSEGSRVP